MREFLLRARAQSDVIVAALAVLIVVMLVIPLPSQLLDVLITLNISAGLIILLITMYTREPLDFSAFPTILLMVTLFRLALNIASTKLILLDGFAGDVINAFGNFVVGGNLVVGLIIFLILVIVQYVVITNGATRVAEVAARFTLDAMPGKQMAIDADLNSGLIGEDEAKARRKKITDEADFYASMDGASKFVKGDAIAGIIIVMINLFAGFIIGMAQRGLDFGTALSTYSLLSVGDGLVSQVPALLISVGVGIIVTRANTDSNLGEQITSQVFNYPRALFVASAALFGFAIIPGMPTVPFLIIATAVGLLAFALRGQAREDVAAEELASAQAAIQPRDDGQPTLSRLDVIEVELGHGLLSLVDNSVGGDLISRISAIRRQTALDMGFLLPPVRVRDNVQLAANNYSIKIKGVEVAGGNVQPGMMLAMHSDEDVNLIDGIATTEPVYGLPAKWIAPASSEDAEILGFTVIDPAAMVATHITEVTRQNAPELLGRQDVRAMLDQVQETHPAVIDELIPGMMSLAEVHKVLQNLLAESVPVRDLVTILEVLGEKARVSKDIDMLTEFVRQGLARQITNANKHIDGSIHVLTLEPQIEQAIVDNLKFTEHGAYVVMEPATAQAVLERLRDNVEHMINLGYHPLLLCSAAARPHVSRFFRQFIPKLAVISHNEVVPGQRIESRGMVGVGAGELT